MNKRSVLTISLVLTSLILMKANVFAKQPDTGKIADKEASKWLKSKIWSCGIKQKAHGSVNAAEFERQYQANKPLWDKAFEFIKHHNLDTLKPGKYPIDGDNVYATITDGPSKEFDKSTWESHQNYIDLQYVIRGKEKIGVTPVDKAVVTKPYDPAKDVANYTAEGIYYIATPKEFFLFFPRDAHRPNIKEGDDKPVKKLVIKIKIAK